MIWEVGGEICWWPASIETPAHGLGYFTYSYRLIYFHKFRNGNRQTKSLGETVGIDRLDTK